MGKRGLDVVRGQVRRRQERDHRGLRGAIVGRGLTLPSELEANQQLTDRQVAPDTRYRRMGQIALVYLSRRALATHRGTTFYNQAQVTHAIDHAPKSVGRDMVVGRGALWLADEPFRRTSEGWNYYWLLTNAERSQPADGRPAVNFMDEERGLARELFWEAPDKTAPPLLWLGAVSAPDFSAAQNALEPLEAVLGSSMAADPVSLIPAPRR